MCERGKYITPLHLKYQAKQGKSGDTSKREWGCNFIVPQVFDKLYDKEQNCGFSAFHFFSYLSPLCGVTDGPRQFP